MKKIVLASIASLSLLLLLSGTAYASQCPGYETSLVPCGQMPSCRCEITDFFVMLRRVFNFVVFTIATPLAGLIIVFGGVLMLISGGPGGRNPVTGVFSSTGPYQQGKNMIMGAVIAVLLIFCSWLIINVFLTAIGYSGSWSSPFGP